MARDTNIDRRKSACPNCPDHRAIPKAVTYGNGTKTLSYECPGCAHKWEVQEPSPQEEPLP